MASFFLLSEHDYHRDGVLPDHPPEVIGCTVQRTLAGYERSSGVIAL